MLEITANGERLYETVKIPDGFRVSYARCIVNNEPIRSVGHSRDEFVNDVIREICNNPYAIAHRTDSDIFINENKKCIIKLMMFRYGAKGSRGNRNLVGYYEFIFGEDWESEGILCLRHLLKSSKSYTSFKPNENRDHRRCLQCVIKDLIVEDLEAAVKDYVFNFNDTECPE